MVWHAVVSLAYVSSASASAAVASTSFTSALATSSSIASSVRLAVVVDLGLESGNGGHERLHHLFHHALILLGGISHVVDLLLHLLFSYGFGIHGCLGISLCGQSVDKLVDDGGCIRLSMETEGISGDGRLTPFDCLLRFSETIFEGRPGSVNFRLVVPFSDVAGKDGGSGDDDEADVDELGHRLEGFGSFCHVGVVIDCCEDVHDGPGVVVGCVLQGGLGGGQNLWSNGIVSVKKFFQNLCDRAFEEPCVIVN